MGNKLTWADVAHYYAKNDPAPEIYTWIWKSEDEGYWSNAFEPVADSLPQLIDLADITEEDARKVLEMIGCLFEAHEKSGGWVLWFMRESYSHGATPIQRAIGNPAAIHYLIQHNYNVFGIETWKGVQS